MKNFRPFSNKSELIAEYANHSPIRDKEDLVFVLRDKCNSIIRTFRLKENREFPYDIEDGAVLDWHTLYENYTFLDGSPCGVFEKVSKKADSKDYIKASLYEQIQALSIEPDGLKEYLLEKVKFLNESNSQLECELHNCRIEVENMKEIIFKLTCKLYGE